MTRLRHSLARLLRRLADKIDPTTFVPSVTFTLPDGFIANEELWRQILIEAMRVPPEYFQ